MKSILLLGLVEMMSGLVNDLLYTMKSGIFFLFNRLM